MEFIFLGTSAGTPTKFRNVTGFALLETSGRSWYLVDCGEATQHQILRTPLSLRSLGAIFITHIHGDHCYGLPGVLASAGMSGREEPLVIVAPAGIQEWLNSTMLHTSLHLPFELQFLAAESLAEQSIGNYVVSSVALSHRLPSYAYSFTEVRQESRLNQEKLQAHGIARGPLWGEIKKGVDVELNGKWLRAEEYLLFDYEPRKIVVCGDNDTPELLANVSAGCHVLVHEATYTEEVARKSGELWGHSSAARVASFANNAAIPNLVLTHFSPRYQRDATKSPSIMDVHQEASANYQGNLFLAEDFAHYRLDKTGVLHRIEPSSNPA